MPSSEAILEKLQEVVLHYNVRPLIEDITLKSSKCEEGGQSVFLASDGSSVGFLSFFFFKVFFGNIWNKR